MGCFLFTCVHSVGGDGDCEDETFLHFQLFEFHIISRRLLDGQGFWGYTPLLSNMMQSARAASVSLERRHS